MYAIKANPFPVQILYVVGLIPLLYFLLFILYKLLSRVSLFITDCQPQAGVNSLVAYGSI